MTTVSDNFDRADGAPGANWTSDSGAWSIVSNTLRQGTAGGSYRKLRWAGTALSSSDNYSQVAASGNSSSLGAGAFVRGAASSTVTYYAAAVFCGDSDYLLEITAGGEGILDTGSARANGTYTVRVEANGSNLAGKIDGSASTSASDASLSSGAVGCMSFDTLGDANNKLDTWEAADLAAAGAIAATIAATATQTADLKGAGALASTITATGSLSPNLTGRGALATTITAAGALTANLAGAGALASTMAATAAQTADLKGAGALASTITATGSLTGDLVDGSAPSGALAANIAASASLAAALAGTGELNFTTTATADLVAALTDLSHSADIGGGGWPTIGAPPRRQKRDLAAHLAATSSFYANLTVIPSPVTGEAGGGRVSPVSLWASYAHTPAEQLALRLTVDDEELAVIFA